MFPPRYRLASPAQAPLRQPYSTTAYLRSGLQRHNLTDPPTHQIGIRNVSRAENETFFIQVLIFEVHPLVYHTSHTHPLVSHWFYLNAVYVCLPWCNTRRLRADLLSPSPMAEPVYFVITMTLRCSCFGLRGKYEDACCFKEASRC